MKKTVLLLGAIALLSSPAFSQRDTSIGLRLPTQKGSWMLGSNLVVGELAFGSISSDYEMEGVYNVSLDPRAGYFVKDNLMVGGMLNVNFNGNSFGAKDYFNRHHTQSIGLGVFARKYFGKAAEKDGSMRRTRFFVEAGAGYNKGWASYYIDANTKEHATFSTGSFHLMPGVNYFFNKNIALEGGIHMSHTGGSSNVIGNANRVGINLGLQIFMGKR